MNVFRRNRQMNRKMDRKMNKNMTCRTMARSTMHQQLFQFTLVGLLTTLAACGDSSQVVTTYSDAPDGEAIVLTDVDFDPDTLIPETQPVADYLAANLNAVGIRKGEVQIAPDSDTVAQWMASGEVDLYFDSVYPVMRVMEASGATPILRRWKDGVAEYNTLFVARRDSGLRQLADLQGEMLAFQDPDSSSGFMFPVIYMLEQDMTLVRKAEPNHAVAEDEIGYVFSGREDTTVEWVLNGKVAAGTIDDETFRELSEEDRKQLVVLAETEMYPRHVVLAAPDLTPQQIEAIKTTLVGMDESREGQAALKEFSDTAQFDEFPEGSEAAITRLQDAYNHFQDFLKTQQQ
jgi:phosphonate transport system substrate-binding protein